MVGFTVGGRNRTEVCLCVQVVEKTLQHSMSRWTGWTAFSSTGGITETRDTWTHWDIYLTCSRRDLYVRVPDVICI